jgi:hypothetical protein
MSCSLLQTPTMPNAGRSLACTMEIYPPKVLKGAKSVKRRLDFDDMYEIEPIALFQEPVQKRPKLDLN